MQFAARACVLGARLLCCSIGLFLGIVVAFPVRPVEASTFVLMDENDLAEQSVAAVTGRVADVRSAAESDGSVRSFVTIEPEEVVFGELPSGRVVLREQGGWVRGRGERVFGAAEYSVGERVLVFLSQNRDGTLRTTAMSMGKYRLAMDARGIMTAQRDFGDGVALFDPRTQTLRERSQLRRQRLSRMLHRIRKVRPRRRARHLRNAAVPAGAVPVPSTQSSFTFLGQPSRWFEPDVGGAIDFLIDLNGDEKFGPVLTRAIANDALAEWSAVPSSSLLLADGGLTEPTTFAGCDGPNRLVFNDPFDEVSDPNDCRGVLAIGGFCFDDQDTRTVNGTTFHRITLGKVTFADGWSNCKTWTPCNLAEVATHELGHTVGFGHSEDDTATMAAVAQFDGRCAALAVDDLDALNTVYPAGFVPPTVTRTPTRTARPTRTMPSTFTPIPTPSRDAGTEETPTPRAPNRVSVSGRIRYYASNQPVSEVTIHLLGSVSETTFTQSDGAYGFGRLHSGSRSLRPSKVGGIGSGISALDAALVLRASRGESSLDRAQALACDVTGNGTVSPLDAAWILQVKADMGGHFPVAETCGSDWAFLPVPAPAENQTVVDPEIALPTCRPGAVELSPLASNVTGQDFLGILFGDCSGNWQTDEIGIIQEDAPEGSALDLQPMRRARGGRLRLPIGVFTPSPFFSLDLHLRYDPMEIEARNVRPVPSDGPLLRYNASTPGRLVISLASPEPIPGNGDVLIVVEFQDLNVDEAVPEVVASFAAIDEQLLPRR